MDEEFRRARRELNHDPENMDNLLRLAKLHRQRKEFALSDRCYCQILLKDVENLDALNGIAWNLMLQDEWEEAEEFLDRALGVDPMNPATLINRSWCHLASYHYSSLLKPARIVTKMIPEKSDAWVQMGIGLYGSGEEGVIQCHQKALELDPDHIIAIAYLAMETEYKAESIPWLKRLTELTPEMTHGWASLAAVQLYLGMVDESLGNWQKVLDIDPLRFDAIEYMAFILWVKGDNASSLECLHRLDEFEFDTNQCYIWRECGEYGREIKEATAFFDRYSKKYPGSWFGHQVLGLSLIHI